MRELEAELVCDIRATPRQPRLGQILVNMAIGRPVAGAPWCVPSVALSRGIMCVLTVLACLAVDSPALDAQQDPSLARGFDLERRGNFVAAAEAYRAVLALRPADPSALLGLERALTPLARVAEMEPEVSRALAAGDTSTAVFGVAMRVWAAIGEPDSMRLVADRWSQIDPGDETPYREWGMALMAQHDRAGAKEAFLLGRQRLGNSRVLAAELALIAGQDLDYPAAAREWLLAVRQLPGYRGPAVTALAPAPEGARPAVRDALLRDGSPEGRRLAAPLIARWGAPSEGYRLLAEALPEGRAESAEALRTFLDQLRGLGTPEARLAQGLALEALADRLTGAQVARTRLEAARAFSAAGDAAAARRMIARIAADSAVAPDIKTGAAGTLVQVLLKDGKVAQAAEQLEASQGEFSADDLAELRRAVALGWMRAGEPGRAEAALGADSSVDGAVLAGRFRLYSGDLKGARQLLLQAGPYAGSRAEITTRASLLSLLQQVSRDSLTVLGTAFLKLDQGDTTAAVVDLGAVARALGPESGGAEVALFGGRLEAARGWSAEAERFFRLADDSLAPATAPAAELELAQLYLGMNRADEATRLLEHLILTYPTSALIPQARRSLDEARGRVPKT